MTKENLQELWNYYSMLEDDLNHTSRYVEPKDQEDTFSIEFAKLLILACTEVESVFKLLCKSINNETPGNIGKYKQIIIEKYPHFGDMEVTIPRLNKTIKPFENWRNNYIHRGKNSFNDDNKLTWWEAYTSIKHYRAYNFTNASYTNACNAISALHILILRLGKTNGIDVNDFQGNYIKNPYCGTGFLMINTEAKEWPDIN